MPVESEALTSFIPQIRKVAREAAEKTIGEAAVSPKNYLESTKRVKGKQKKEQPRLTKGTTPSLFDESTETEN